jgi:hypothetical protein
MRRASRTAHHPHQETTLNPGRDVPERFRFHRCEATHTPNPIHQRAHDALAEALVFSSVTVRGAVAIPYDLCLSHRSIGKIFSIPTRRHNGLASPAGRLRREHLC